MKKKISLVLVLLLTIMSLVGCQQNSKTSENKNNNDADKSSTFKTDILFNGSSTLAPVIAKISTNYIEKYTTWDKAKSGFPEKNIAIYVSAGGSSQGVKSVLDKSSDFGLVSRDLKDSEKESMKNLKEFKVGIDALTIAVNPNNPLYGLKQELTKEDLVKIFSGEYKNYSDIDSSLPEKEIVVITRDIGGGAHEVFQNKIMGDTEVKSDAIQAPSMGALVTKIIENDYAIGYASFGVVNQNEGKIVTFKVDGVEPTDENILNGSYIIQRPLLVVKDGELTESEQEFMNYLTGQDGMDVIEDMGFIPCREQ